MKRSQAGVTLVELMIAGVIGLVAITTLLALYSASARQNRIQLASAHLHQQLHGALFLIGRDIRRSGFWQFDPARQAAHANPFQRPPNRLQIGAYRGEARDSCVLLAYDLDRDGRVGVGTCARGGCSADSDDDNTEQFGYRLRDGRLQSRYGGTPFSCDTGAWQSLSDPSIEITRLHFEASRQCMNIDSSAPCDRHSARLTRQAVRVELGAQPRGRPDAALTLTQWIRVRNDRLETGAP